MGAAGVANIASAASGGPVAAAAAPRFDLVSSLRYGATAAGASLLALFLAMRFQLDQPYWAATTVLIVAQPLPGQVVGKGFYRAVGTIAGAVAGAGLVGLFAQAPASFVAALAFWIAACTGLATLLRGFRTYAAVLSGYTAAIVALSALPTPDRTFDIAVARGSAILLGIVCGALAAALLIPARSRDELLRRVAAAIADAAGLVGQIGSGASTRAARRRLVAELAAIEALGPTAAAEDLSLRRRRGGLGGTLVELLGTVSALRAIDEHLRRLGPEDRAALLARARPDLDGAAATARALAERATGIEPASKAAVPVLLREDGAGIGRTILADRLGDALDHLGRAQAAQAFLLGTSSVRPTARLVFHRDTRQAGRNALRAFLAVSLAGAFAIASAWSAGGTFLTNIGVACSLFATQPRPSAGAFGFLRGAALALVAAFAVKFYVLPSLDGFGMLALALFPVLVAGTIATTVPGWLGTATAFNVLFLSDLAPANVMSYDPASYLDGGVATLAAFAVGGTVFRVVLPTDPDRTARRLASRLRRDVAALASGRVRREAALHAAMYDRVGQVVAAAADPVLTEGSISTLGVATEVARLRALGPVGVEVGPVLAALADGLPAAVVAERCDAAIGSLDGAGRDASARVAAALSSIRDAIAENRVFYEGGEGR